jgi:hypothetical protein
MGLASKEINLVQVQKWRFACGKPHDFELDWVYPVFKGKPANPEGRNASHSK